MLKEWELLCLIIQKNKEESDTIILNDGMRIECNVWKQKKL
jgi:hypothetical protein